MTVGDTVIQRQNIVVCPNSKSTRRRNARINRNGVSERVSRCLTCLSTHNMSFWGRGFYESNDPTNSVKALTEVAAQMIRLQSCQVHLTMLQYYNITINTKTHEQNTHRLHKNEPKLSEMGAVRQGLLNCSRNCPTA